MILDTLVKVIQVSAMWQDINGTNEIGEQYYRNPYVSSSADNEEQLTGFVTPMKLLGFKLYLSNSKFTFLKVKHLPRILPDQTGVLVIFQSEPKKGEGFDYYPPPNNAAIYNADGSLRGVLKIPQPNDGCWIGGLHGGEAVDPKYKGMLRLVIAPHPDAYPEWVYAVDPDQLELIPTYQCVRW